MLTAAENRHYSRHLLLKELGPSGQEKLKSSSVLIIGCGGLGCPAATYLAAAGIGRITLIDPDTVDESNLHRQVAADVGAPKAEVLAARLRANNPYIHISARQERFQLDNAAELVSSHDLVVDGSDNFPTRYLANDACFFAKRPLVFGAIHQFSAQLSLFNAAPSLPCYRCLFPEPPDAGSIPNCDEAGVLGVLPGLCGSLMASEAVKFLAGIGTSLAGQVLTCDLLQNQFQSFKLPRDPSCPLCGQQASIHHLSELNWSCTSKSSPEIEISPSQLQQEIESGQALCLLDVRETWEFSSVAIAGSINIPLGQVPQNLDKLPRDLPIRCICHHGVRSLKARELLAAAGFTNVRSLQGGVDLWADEIDMDMPKY
jgi:adenylyltransferase/sulfurtransferase